MSPLFPDMVCNADGEVIDWEVIYNRIEYEHSTIIVTKTTTDSIKPSGLQFKGVSYSFLDRIGARKKILSYTHMIRWLVENLTNEDRQFRNLRMELMGSFKAKDLKKMFHIHDPHDI